jgi:uncharacterized protein
MMNTDLTHLPKNKRDDLQRIVKIVRQHCPEAGMIILFGSYARGDYKELKDLAPDRKSGHPSDYDILTIVEDEEDCDSLVWQKIAEECAGAKLSATPRFIHHDRFYLNIKLERGHYFFSDIIGEGKLLYDDGTMELAKPKELSTEERLEIAQEDYAEWFGSAEEFYKLYKYSLSEDMLKKAAFNLHQASEAAYKAVLIIFTGYIPDEHYLSYLGSQAAKVDPAFDTRAIFTSGNEFERDAFTALEYAYIGARYDKRYTIDEKTVTYLSGRVETLLQLTEERCNEKIAALQTAI